jgi:CTP-dependent riboflavin kinase
VGVVKESFDAEVGFEPYKNTGVNVSVWQNENIQRLIVRHESGQEQIIINPNTYSTTTIEFGTGNYYLIGENNQDKKRLLSKKRIE